MRKTSDMRYPLEAPNGWFLYHAKHEHTAVQTTADHHEPLPHAEGPWVVAFQQYPKGGKLTSGRGFSLEEAWEKASKAVEQVQRKDNFGIV